MCFEEARGHLQKPVLSFNQQGPELRLAGLGLNLFTNPLKSFYLFIIFEIVLHYLA